MNDSENRAIGSVALKINDEKRRETRCEMKDIRRLSERR